MPSVMSSFNIDDSTASVIFPISFRKTLYQNGACAASTQIIRDFHFPPKIASPYSSGQRILFPFWVDTRMISLFWFDFVFHKTLCFPQLLGFSEQPIFTKSRYRHCCPYRLLLLLIQTVNAYSASSPSASSSSRARMEMLIRLFSMSISKIFTFSTSPIATISFTFSTRLSAS